MEMHHLRLQWSVQNTSGLRYVWCDQRVGDRIQFWNDTLLSWTYVLRVVRAMEGLKQ